MNRSYRIALILTLSFSIILSAPAAYAQTNSNVDAVKDLLKYFLRPQQGGVADCDSRYKDENGKCLSPEQLLNKCSAIGKIDKNGNYNSACCLTNEQCEANGPLQTCDIPNDFCNSGTSCNNHGQPAPSPNPRDLNPERALDNFPYYCQGDNRWRYEGGLDQMGCGPTAMAMALRYFGFDESPPSVNRVFLANGWRPNIFSGTYIEKVVEGKTADSQAFLQKYKLVVGPNLVYGNTVNLEAVKDHLKNGFLIYALSNGFECGGGCAGLNTKITFSHLYIIDKVDERGKVRVRDPSNCVWPASSARQGSEVWADEYLYRNAREVNAFAYPIKKQ